MSGGAAGQRGQGTVEFALTFPLVFLLILGILESGLAFSAYGIVVFAAREGSRAAAVYQSVPACTQAQNDSNRASGAGCTPAYTDNVRDSVARSLAWLPNVAPYFEKANSATPAPGVAPGVSIAYTPATSLQKDRGGERVTVEVGYQYHWLTGALGLPPLLLKGSSSVNIEP